MTTVRNHIGAVPAARDELLSIHLTGDFSMMVNKEKALEVKGSAVTLDTANEHAADSAGSPGKLTFLQNVLYTLVVLGGMGLVVGLLWGINYWIAPK